MFINDSITYSNEETKCFVISRKLEFSKDRLNRDKYQSNFQNLTVCAHSFGI